MQPKWPFLPEFDSLRGDPKPGPVLRPRHIALAKMPGKLVDPPLELGAAGEGSRLVRGPGADLAVPRPAGEIGVRLRVVDRFDNALDAHLPVQRLPQKAQCRVRIG